ncbi:hypothetical protein [Bifidobacterium sp. ESL0800]|uniref:hypothetical protein n=1 Tax=Bifidobacterium sp. ESL0800 TaxID=2983236 RepID=UPI0023F7FA45|nr:hypothetical protein [Bifidobacterium sp. ESL0800]WEV76368.1 hypothetical protein OZX75_04100 [Bifidobacterium sp. ESL0800]
MVDVRQDTNDDESRQWYFNTATGKPELGKLSPVGQRSGPYKSRKDAQDAWKIVRERNLIWDEQNRKWNAWDNDSDDAESENQEA